jgi:putative aldouronate transport system substrate-binding protein
MFTLSQGDYLLFRQLQENDMLEDLLPGSEKCLNDFIINTLATYEGRNLAPFRFGGKLLAFAGGRYGYDSHNQMWLRTDWLDKYGFDAPMTVDDLESVLIAWRDNPPSPDYVGIPLRENRVGDVYSGHSFSPIFGAFNVYPNAWVKNAEGVTIWGSVAPEAKQAPEIMARWYKDGLIDKQFATGSTPGYRGGMVVAGQAGAVFAPWWFPYTVGEFPVENPEGALKPYNAPVDSDGNFSIMFPGAAGEYVMIRKGYSNPEAVFKVMNCEFDMWFELDPIGAELVMPNRQNNVSWTYMFPTSGVNVARNEEVPHAGAVAKQCVEDGVVTMEVWNPMYVTMGENAADYAKTGVVDGMNWIDYTCRYIASGADLMLAQNRKIVLPEFYFVTDSMADIKPNLDTLEDTTFLKIIMGELPIDAFDQFVADWYAQGGQTITDEVRQIVGY